MLQDNKPTAEQYAIQAALRTMIPQAEESPGEVGRLEGSLSEFVKAAWHVIEPGIELKWSWHMDAICSHLGAVTDGCIKRLLINIPPSCSKSLLVCVFWPSWEWAIRPQQRWLFASYDQRLSTRDSIRCRYLLSSQWYQRRWGHRIKFTKDENQKTYFSNTESGYRLATSVGGHATGEHPGRIVLDDPHSVAKAESADQRQSVIDWFDQTLSTRGMGLGVSQVVIMQRLHMKDLSGHILAKSADWDHINLAMRFEVDSMKKPTSIGWRDPRSVEGELLAPRQFSEKIVTKLEESLGSYPTASQLQQRPSPKGGGMLRRDWFKFVGQPPQGEGVRRCRFWDLAHTSKKTSDYTVGALLSVKDGIYYIENIQRDRWSPARRDKQMCAMADLDGREVPIRIEREPAAGHSLIPQLVRMLAGWNVRGVPISGSKEARMQGLASQSEYEHVKIVQRKDSSGKVADGQYWIEAMLDEFENFPHGEHDDIVDACAGAFNYLCKTPLWSDGDVTTEEDVDVDGMDEEEREEFLAGMNEETRAFFED